jgi:beta-galactosidase
MDVLGLNYQEPLYPHLRAKDPNLVVIGTESFRYYRSNETQRSGFDPKNPWHDVAAHEWVVGQFLWAGFDYLGESQVWPVKGYVCGLLDTCGFLKPDAFFHKSVWSKEPLVRLAVVLDGLGSGEAASPWGAPRMALHWNFEGHERELLRLETQTNCESVELRVNGVSHGVRRAEEFLNAALVWFVPYQPGIVEAIGRVGSEVVARDVLRTAGAAARLELTPDRSELVGDGHDLCHVEVRVVDAEGTLVQTADRALEFGLEGPGILQALDNGDLASLEPYQGSSVRSTRLGRCLAYVKASRESGQLGLTVRAPGLPEARLSLSVSHR